MDKLKMKFCVLSCCVFGLSCGFVLLSSAAETDVFQQGKAWRYDWTSSLLLNDKHGGSEQDVGFNLQAGLWVESRWASGEERLLKIKLEEPRLQIRAKADGFQDHSSLLETLTNKDFYIRWKRGQVLKVLLAKDEPISLKNLKKGIASLLQFQILDGDSREVDASGSCDVRYSSQGPNVMVKTKWNCRNEDLPSSINPEALLTGSVESQSVTNYKLSEDRVDGVSSEDWHQLTLSAREEVGNALRSKQLLQFAEAKGVETVSGGDFNEAFSNLEPGDYLEETLITELEHFAGEETAKSFAQLVDGARESLKGNQLGSLASAKSFLKLVDKARRSSKEDLSKALGSKKNQKILHQLVDVLGYTQTYNSQAAMTKKFHFDDGKHEEYLERYLWALQASSQPNPEIIADLLGKFKKTQNIKENLKETMIMAIASMAHHLVKASASKDNLKVHRDVEDTIVNYMDAGRDLYYLRALRNLRSPTTMPALLKVIAEGKAKEEVLAWTAIKAMPTVNGEVLRVAERTFYQLDRAHDSSARTLALDVLLENEIPVGKLRHLVYFLIGNDRAYEIKQYAIQRFRMMAENCDEFRAKLLEAIGNDRRILNYAAWGQKGLSVALVRPFLRGASSNGSLLTVQEMSSGIVKRGTVNVVMDKDGLSQEMFSLGVFTGGLSSFISSDSDGGEADDEVATAGMELSVLGNQLRPFTFFSGQGELMGHVWSGTASDRTTAFQALAMLHDQRQFIRLGSGFIAELDLKGAASMDLAGQIQFSLWNRNAESLVEKSAAILVAGTTRVDSTFVRSQVEFSLSLEPKLHLRTDIDFSNDIVLCMRLTQPPSTLRHSVYKIERIPGGKHRLRKSRSVSSPIHGRTYALNRKNSEMCSALFK